MLRRKNETQEKTKDWIQAQMDVGQDKQAIRLKSRQLLFNLQIELRKGKTMK